MLLAEFLVIRFDLASARLAPHIFIGGIVSGCGIVASLGVAVAVAAITIGIMALTYVLHVRIIRLVSAVLCGQHLIGMHCRLIR